MGASNTSTLDLAFQVLFTLLFGTGSLPGSGGLGDSARTASRTCPPLPGYKHTPAFPTSWSRARTWALSFVWQTLYLPLPLPNEAFGQVPHQNTVVISYEGCAHAHTQRQSVQHLVGHAQSQSPLTTHVSLCISSLFFLHKVVQGCPSLWNLWQAAKERAQFRGIETNSLNESMLSHHHNRRNATQPLGTMVTAEFPSLQGGLYLSSLVIMKGEHLGA